ncbi:uncharacterized protein B0H18DRAFT_1118412 [Fomitopsis serialis]|uniref:uncharacterized protein n=1 Tax=Fomitopsis serialis TaxID=139415 RepID=UPI0020086C50|nr:uncharacterized protein B0H18DRAFT_1118412 [Neoantrodia serialis]KAH9927607.1 hypothetical protein B0H18DRAFT_1118412 [Neoantrodia serialis]
MKFIIGDVPDHANPRRIRHAEHFREVKNGDVVDAFDHIIVWDDDCVTADLVQRWRMMDDPLCDKALQTVFQASGSSKTPTVPYMLSFAKCHSIHRRASNSPAVKQISLESFSLTTA